MRAIKTPNNRGQMHLATGTTLAFAATDTYEKIVGTWTDGCANNFVVDDVNDRITYTGKQTMCMLMNGVSDCQVNKNCQISYALYRNGSLVTGAETPHTFQAVAKYSNISITTLLNINSGDYFEVFAKCDAGDTTLTINSLKILFFGEN
jgi:hypothetical protein